MPPIKSVFSEKNRLWFKQKGIQAIYLFGSRALGVHTPLSDYDYAVLTTKRGHQKGGTFYEDLYNIFSEISPRTLKNDVMDIVFLKDVGLELRFYVIR